MELLLLTRVYWQPGGMRPSSLIARRGNHGMSKRKAPSMATTSLRLYVDMREPRHVSEAGLRCFKHSAWLYSIEAKKDRRQEGFDFLHFRSLFALRACACF